MKKPIDNFPFNNCDEPSLSEDDASFVSKIDLNKHLHLKNIGNKLLFNSFPYNIEEIFLNKKENIFLDDDISDSDNIFFYPSNKNIELKNKKKNEFDKILEKNTIIKNDVNIKPYSYTLSNSGMETRIKEKTKKIFFIIKTKKISLFTEVNKEDQIKEIKEINEKHKFIKKKRRRNKEDEIRRMIGRRFFNDILYNKINDILKKQGSDIFFEKIQPDLIYDLVKKCNKHLLNKNLEEILITKELYKGKNMEKYFHNIKVLYYLRSEDYLEIRERTQIDKILKMKYVELFKEYISSKEFVEEIDRLKNNKEKFDNCYINRYIYYSLHFLENFRD